MHSNLCLYLQVFGSRQFAKAVSTSRQASVRATGLNFQDVYLLKNIPAPRGWQLNLGLWSGR